MAFLNRINGPEELYVGGIWGIRPSRLVTDNKITHVLSVINYRLDAQEPLYRDMQHLSIDIDDMEDQDILVHLPKMVRFIERGLYGDDSPALSAAATTIKARPNTKRAPSSSTPPSDPDAITPAPPLPPSAELARLDLTTTTDDQQQPQDQESLTQIKSTTAAAPGAVYVHCAMGKSRSVTAVVAYLLWKHPHRFGRADPTTTARQAVEAAVKWVRASRPIAEPNDGFLRQLELFWEMGCPAGSGDAVEREPAYQRWVYKRAVGDSVRVGRAPDVLRFEDEEGVLRCKKCRRVLATKQFIIPHQGRGNDEKKMECPHFFVEALSWMRPILEEGELEGRLVCGNGKCQASVGRYSWQGFKCGCGDWVAPAFSLHKSKVDEHVVKGGGGGRNWSGAGGDNGERAKRMAALGIRMPPPPRGVGGGGGGSGENESPTTHGIPF
ncbi:protein-tyrosine phosphatase-like protein [Bombardia bombarda]|uniref:protein-tyrosine-phosphatase n=1 Tax=Bombardia bombarda TaxID=252184 RepID=A0AA39X0J1_9PEZI|nr:protein-tyrosine phosphatase-like protein [Bombardia bombarda]